MQFKLNSLNLGGRAAMLASVAALGMLGVNGSSLAASATANASAEVQTPISITLVQDLSFGTFAASSSEPTSVTVSPDGTVSPGLARNHTGGSAAQFTVNGEPNETYDITLPAGELSLTHSDGTETMAIRDWTVAPGAEGTVLETAGTLSETGTGNLNVGATLDVAASQRAGNYSTQFAVTVEYN